MTEQAGGALVKTRHEHSHLQTVDFLPPRTVRDESLLLRGHPVPGVLLSQPELTKTLPFGAPAAAVAWNALPHGVLGPLPLRCRLPSLSVVFLPRMPAPRAGRGSVLWKEYWTWSTFHWK